MAIQQFDLGRSVAGGAATAGAINQVQRQNALADLFEKQGADIMSGDVNALRALAAVDPFQAMQVQQWISGERRAQQAAGYATNRENRAAETHRLSLQDRQTEIAEAAAANAAKQTAEENQRDLIAATNLSGWMQSGPNPETYNRVVTFLAEEDPAAAQALGPYSEESWQAVNDLLEGTRKGLLMATGTADPRLDQQSPAPGNDYERYVRRQREAGEPVMNEFEYREAVNATKKPETVINNVSGGNDVFYEALDKKQAEMFNGLIDAGVNSGAKMAQIDELERILLAETTPEGMEAAIKSFLGRYGIETEGLSSIQAAEALVNRMVPEQRAPGSGPMSDADLELFKKSLPRLINTREGNKLILQTLRGIAQYERNQSAIATAVSNRELTPKQGREALMQLENPLAEFREQGQTTVRGWAPDEETQSLIDQFKSAQ